MAIGITSDWHLHEWTYGATITKAGLNSRLMDQLTALNKMALHFHGEGIKEIVMCGDMFHAKEHTSAQAKWAAETFINYLTYLGIKGYFLLGNHDFINKSGSINLLNFIRSPHEVIRQPRLFEIDGTPAILMGYTKDKGLLENTLSKVPKGGLCFLHQGVQGVPMGNGWVIQNEILNQNLPKNIAHLYTGHYHNANYVNNKLTIVGAMTPHDWGDIGYERGYWIHHYEQDDEWYSSNAPMFIRLDMCQTSKFSDDNPALLKRIKGSFVKCTNYKGDIQELRKDILEAGALSFEYDLESIKRTKLGVPKYIEFSFNKLWKEQINKETGRRKDVGQALKDKQYETPST